MEDGEGGEDESGRGREETLDQEERETAFEPGSAGAHEDSHLLPFLVRSLRLRKGEEEVEDEGIIFTSRLTADSSRRMPSFSAECPTNVRGTNKIN